MPSSVRILKNSNYRLYFFGQLISNSGTWMQSVAQSWLIYQVTHSGWWLGMITFCLQLPACLASPIAGVLADQSDRRRVLIATELIAGLQAFLLAALVYFGKVEIWHLVVLSIVLGLINAFEMTTRTAFIVDMVGKTDLSSAITFNAVLFNMSRVLGPTLAGFVLSSVGEAMCFFLNGLSYVVVAYGLWKMTLKTTRPVKSPHSVLANIADGFSYTRRSPVIFRLLILSALICFITWPFVVLLPVFAKTILMGDAHTLAWLMAMMGAGAVFGAFLFIRDDDIPTLKRRLIQNIVLCGICLLVFGGSRNLGVSLLAIFGVGCFMMTLFPTMTNAVQHLVEDSKRGRVGSLYAMTFLGTTPFGSLIVGWLADRYTAPRVVLATGTLTLVMGLVLALRQFMRDLIATVTPV